MVKDSSLKSFYLVPTRSVGENIYIHTHKHIHAHRHTYPYSLGPRKQRGEATAVPGQLWKRKEHLSDRPYPQILPLVIGRDIILPTSTLFWQSCRCLVDTVGITQVFTDVQNYSGCREGLFRPTFSALDYPQAPVLHWSRSKVIKHLCLRDATKSV